METQMDLTKKRILVTGGAGFLGKYVVEALKSRNCSEVFVPEHRQYDLTKSDIIKEVFKLSKPDVVIHMAAVLGGIGAHLNTQGQFLYGNLVMGLEMMEQSRDKVEKYVSIGTACSYPEFAPVPLRAESMWDGFPNEVTAPYGIAKRVMLLQGEYYREQYGLNAVSVIPTSVYGPRDATSIEKSHIIPAQIRNCMEAKRRGRPLTVWGTGKATRDFIYATDCAEAIVRVVERYDKPEPLNLGSGVETPIRDIINMIVEDIGFQGKIIWDASKPEGNRTRSFDVSKAWEEIGFKVTTPLAEGIKRTIDWYTNENSDSIY
jgi:GDP-L-fucose synthase